MALGTGETPAVPGEQLGSDETLFDYPWLEFIPVVAAEESLEIPIQVNGKLRDKLTMPLDTDADTIERLALTSSHDRYHESRFNDVAHAKAQRAKTQRKTIFASSPFALLREILLCSLMHNYERSDSELDLSSVVRGFLSRIKDIYSSTIRVQQAEEMTC